MNHDSNLKRLELNEDQVQLLVELLEHEIRHGCVFGGETDIVRNKRQLIMLWNLL